MTKNPKNKDGEDDVYFLRTLLKNNVYERLKEFAQVYSTGRGDWDFGVAIQILLDHYDESKLGIQAEKIDHILSVVTRLDKGEEPPKEEDMEEMLGGTMVNPKTGEIKCRDIKK